MACGALWQLRLDNARRRWSSSHRLLSIAAERFSVTRFANLKGAPQMSYLRADNPSTQASCFLGLDKTMTPLPPRENPEEKG